MLGGCYIATRDGTGDWFQLSQNNNKSLRIHIQEVSFKLQNK